MKYSDALYNNVGCKKVETQELNMIEIIVPIFQAYVVNIHPHAAKCEFENLWKEPRIISYHEKKMRLPPRYDPNHAFKVDDNVEVWIAQCLNCLQNCSAYQTKLLIYTLVLNSVNSGSIEG